VLNDRPARPSAGGNRKAAWTLIWLAPLCAEATFSGVTMPAMWLLLPALILMYGAGVLFLRELTVRFGGGWPSLILLGVVYELVEDGVGLQALTSPNLYNAAEWGPRVLGFNTTYWESQIGYHIVFSVLIPVLLADLLFPGDRGRPYLGRGGLVLVGIGAASGVGLLRMLIAAAEDPGYSTPGSVLAGIAVAVWVLGYVALRIVPARFSPPEVSVSAPRPAVVAGVVGVAAAGFLALLMPPGFPPDGPVIGSGAFVFIPMAAAAGIAGAAAWLVYRWTAAPNWSTSHWIWLIGGAMIGRTLFAVVTAPVGNDYAWGPSMLAIVLGIVVIALTAYLLGRLSRRKLLGVDGVAPDRGAGAAGSRARTPAADRIGDAGGADGIS
jgi:hypothetical protein